MPFDKVFATPPQPRLVLVPSPPGAWPCPSFSTKGRSGIPISAGQPAILNVCPGRSSKEDLKTLKVWKACEIASYDPPGVVKSTMDLTCPGMKRLPYLNPLRPTPGRLGKWGQSWLVPPWATPASASALTPNFKAGERQIAPFSQRQALLETFSSSLYLPFRLASILILGLPPI